VQITYRIFAQVEQPQPNPGPLAETVRSVLALAPEKLQARHDELRQRLFAALGPRPETETTQ
jgi:hypothetical protein